MHLIVFHLGTLQEVDFGNIVGESWSVVVGVVAVDDDCVAVAPHHHQVACLEENAVTSIDNRLELDGFALERSVGDNGNDAVSIIVRVEFQVWVVLWAALTVILVDYVGMLPAVVAETCQEGAVLGLLGLLVAETILGNDANGVEVGYVAVIFGSLAFAFGE